MPADQPADQPAPTQAEISALIDGNLHLEGPMLPILHAVQAAFGHIPAAALGLIATALNLTRAEVHGVVSFYHDFREAPAGRHVLKLCRAEACQAVGANALAQDVLARLGVDWHGTTVDGAVTVEPVYCLGLCACGPALSLDGRAVGRVDAARLQDVLRGVGV
ncbi:formate dehydrogenase subunit gamma [Roseicitreum antarcticum]|uniref:Formate dehydrogenase gamma subunit n=1 Tax=Roseicitreum antarcticum TaxID=564137 RepID=A0A1H3AVC7_9RHOB|nr:formate dehydrogenase subunit gamma [Roseicitreum antarcticum]SDX33690.1 formate dehydrogenase gamma subunit [Roseicitreum antarcticum]